MRHDFSPLPILNSDSHNGPASRTATIFDAPSPLPGAQLSPDIFPHIAAPCHFAQPPSPPILSAFSLRYLFTSLLLYFFFRNLYSDFSMVDLTPERLAAYFILYVTFLFSTTCHEAAHALAAKLGGDDTASSGGQVSLNPVPHIQREPWGMVVIPIGLLLLRGSIIGWASAPFNPEWERRYPHRSAWMALAGPVTNYILMLLAVVGLHIGASQGWLFTAEGTATFLLHVLYDFFSLNLLLGTFNLLPFAPLDGSTAIMLFMPERTAYRYLDWLRGNSYARVGLLVAILGFYYIFEPFSTFMSRLLLPHQF
jgi:Zn-dependent protease